MKELLNPPKRGKGKGRGGKNSGGKKGKGKGGGKPAAPVKVGYELGSVDDTVSALEISDCVVRKIWALRKTPSRQRMLQMTDPDNEETSVIKNNDGPLSYVYPTVFSVSVVYKDKLRRKEDPMNLTIFFYGKWAHQMSDILAKGDEVKFTCSYTNIFKNEDAMEEGENEYCIAIGDETEVDFGDSRMSESFSIDDQVQFLVVSYPPEGQSGATARTVEIGIDDDNVGTVEKQQFDQINPYNQDKRPLPEEGGSEEGRGDKKKAKVSRHNYSDLADLQAIADDAKQVKPKVDVYGTVVSFAPPRQTIRGEWMSSITLTDESIVDDEDGNWTIVLNVFNAEPSKLPIVTQMGDVLRCHRVIVQKYEDQPQLLSMRGSSFVVIHRLNPDVKNVIKKIDEEKGALDMSEWHVYSTAKQCFTFEVEDAKTSRKMWKWSKAMFSKFPTIVNEDKTFLISGINEEIENPTKDNPSTVSGDLTCLVTAVIPYPRDSLSDRTPFGFIRVWDGTGPSKSDALPLESMHATHAVSTGDPGVESVASVRRVAEGIPKAKLPDSLCGRVVNVAVWEPTHWEFISNGWMGGDPLSEGDWIRLRNIWDGSMGTENGRMLMMGERAGLTPLQNDVFEVQQVIKDHAARIKANKTDYNPASAVYKADSGGKGKGKGKAKKRKTMSKEGKPIHSLAEVLGEPTPSKMMVIANITTIMPFIDVKGDGSDLSKVLVNKVNAETNIVEPAYQFGLRISDSTAQIPVVVTGNTMGNYFFDMRADQLMQKGKGKAKKSNIAAALKSFEGVLNSKEPFEMEIEGVEVQGQKYFIMSGIDTLD